jgi:hypothetical protein
MHYGTRKWDSVIGNGSQTSASSLTNPIGELQKYVQEIMSVGLNSISEEFNNVSQSLVQKLDI